MVRASLVNLYRRNIKLIKYCFRIYYSFIVFFVYCFVRAVVLDISSLIAEAGVKCNRDVDILARIQMCVYVKFILSLNRPPGIPTDAEALK